MEVLVKLPTRRIDIPKDDIRSETRRVEGAKFIVTDRAEWMDMKPILKFVRKFMKRKMVRSAASWSRTPQR